MTLPQPLLDRLAAAAVAEGLADAVYTRLKTPIGTLTIVQGERGVVRVGFDDDDRRRAARRGRRRPRPAHRRLRPRARGHPRRASRATSRATASRSTSPSTSRSSAARSAATRWRSCARVAAGDVVTYGELARRIDHPRAARAVGSACATNPVPIIVPCHRVVPGGGGVGSYGGGPEIKRRLLAHEGARV